MLLAGEYPHMLGPTNYFYIRYVVAYTFIISTLVSSFLYFFLKKFLYGKLIIELGIKIPIDEFFKLFVGNKVFCV